jgi:hypothetical protein
MKIKSNEITVGTTFAEGGTCVRLGRIVRNKRGTYREVFVTLGTGTLQHKRLYNIAGSVTVL